MSEYRIDAQGLKRRIRHKTYKKVVDHSIYPQTYRVFVTLECGHKTSFTVAANKRHAPGWSPPGKLDCWPCSPGGQEYAKRMAT
jgi:hypothetical protein